MTKYCISKIIKILMYFALHKDFSCAYLIQGITEVRNDAVCQFTVFSNVFGILLLQVHVNGKRIYPAYSNSVLQLTNTIKAMTLEIPEINTKVVYRTSSFKIDIPSSLFGGNTEGQCGELPDHLTPDHGEKEIRNVSFIKFQVLLS